MENLPKEGLGQTGLFKVANEKPIRPVTAKWLVTLGFITIAMAIAIVFGAYQKNYTAAACASSAAILVLWFGVAFLWHTVRQLSDKIEALTRIIEKDKGRAPSQ